MRPALMEYLIIKWLHVLSSTILFGTGIGSAYYLLVATLNRDPRAVHVVARYVVIADWIFTTPAIVFQPLSGYYLAHLAGIPYSTRWIVWSLFLYLLATTCWLPVLWLQLRMRDLARTATEQRLALPLLYWRYFAIWVALGVPAFLALVGAFYLMVVKTT
jgi:uncharacterized membrane protein